LYQPGQPRIVAAPPAFVARGGFRFAASEGSKENPWQLLEARRDDGAIPAIGEAHTVQWMLKSGLGGTVSIQDEQGTEVQLRIVALLQDSAFQGELFIGSSEFRTLFPRQEGFANLLIDPNGHADAVRQLLLAAFSDRGITVETTREKVQSYLQVENTYLSTFQALGGLGLLLGTIGLAAIMFRNVLERRRELALLRAVGYDARRVSIVIVAEAALLLGAGLAVGAGCAALAVAPAWLGRGGSLPGPGLLGLLLAVAAAGLLSSIVATRAALGGNVLEALRAE
jgi:hypothetical protein